MKGLVGALYWWGAWGPGPLGPPLNPALFLHDKDRNKQTNESIENNTVIKMHLIAYYNYLIKNKLWCEAQQTPPPCCDVEKGQKQQFHYIIKL